jgi:hypothetical protein
MWERVGEIMELFAGDGHWPEIHWDREEPHWVFRWAQNGLGREARVGDTPLEAAQAGLAAQYAEEDDEPISVGA